jgi:hypothetical protein
MCTAVPYTSAEARRQLLDTVAAATDQLGVALAALSEAYEQVDERTADTVEAELFRPVQTAYGRAQRTHAEFAARHGVGAREFATPAPGAPGRGARGFLDDATASLVGADAKLAALQDSMLPVEVGDEQLRAGLEAVRELIDQARTRVRAIERTLGR